MLHRISGVLGVAAPQLGAHIEVRALKATDPPGVPVLTVAGGERRQDSVRLGLAALAFSANFSIIFLNSTKVLTSKKGNVQVTNPYSYLHLRTFVRISILHHR